MQETETETTTSTAVEDGDLQLQQFLENALPDLIRALKQTYRRVVKYNDPTFYPAVGFIIYKIISFEVFMNKETI